MSDTMFNCQIELTHRCLQSFRKCSEGPDELEGGWAEDAASDLSSDLDDEDEDHSFKPAPKGFPGRGSGRRGAPTKQVKMCKMHRHAAVLDGHFLQEAGWLGGAPP